VYPTLEEIPDNIDLVEIVVPAPLMPTIMEQAVKKRVEGYNYNILWICGDRKQKSPRSSRKNSERRWNSSYRSKLLRPNKHGNRFGFDLYFR